MSRRCHHGSPRHVPLGRVPRRPAIGEPLRRVGTADLEGVRAVNAAESDTAADADEPGEGAVAAAASPFIENLPPVAVAIAEPAGLSPAPEPLPAPRRTFAPSRVAPVGARPALRSFQSTAHQPVANPPHGPAEGEDAAIERTATAPQLDRKSTRLNSSHRL